MGKNKTTDDALAITKKWQVPSYNDALARDGIDAKKVMKMAAASPNEPIKCTLLFDVRINGKVRRAGEEVSLMSGDFATLATQGVIKETARAEHLDLLENAVPIRAVGSAASVSGGSDVDGRIAAAEARAAHAEERAAKAERAADIAGKAAEEAARAIAELKASGKK